MKELDSLASRLEEPFLQLITANYRPDNEVIGDEIYVVYLSR